MKALQLKDLSNSYCIPLVVEIMGHQQIDSALLPQGGKTGNINASHIYLLAI